MRGNMLIVSLHISIDISYSRFCRYCSVCLSPSQLQTVQYIPYRTVPYINWSKVGLYGTPIPYGIRYGTPCGTVYRIPKFGPLYIGSVYRKFWTKWRWTKLLRTNLLGPAVPPYCCTALWTGIIWSKIIWSKNNLVQDSVRLIWSKK